MFRRFQSPSAGSRPLRDLMAALLGALLLLVPLLVRDPGDARAQDAGDSRSRGSADRFEDRFLGDERVSWLFGNVVIDRDTVTAVADTGIVYRTRDLFELRGNVVLTSDEAVVTCRRAVYDKELGAGDFFGDVRLVEGEIVGTGGRGEVRRAGRELSLIDDALLVTPEYSVRADTIYRDRLTGQGEAFGNVQIMEPGSQNLVTGDHAIFHSETDMAQVDRNPRLTSRQQAGGTLVSTAGDMRFFRTENQVVMTDSVRIRQGAVRAKADTAVAHGTERLVLTGAPEVRRGGTNVMIGDEIEFEYAGGQLRRVILVGNARMEDTAPDSLAALYRGLPDMDVLAGDSISMEFEEQEIRRSVVVGNASSRFTPLDLTDEVATNDVKGDTIYIYFRNEGVQRVDVRGHMSGTYRFARIADMQQKLGQSRRLADLLAEADEDSLEGDEADSLRLAAVDSLAREVGLEVPAGAAEQATRSGMVDSLLTAALDSLAGAGLDTSRSDLDFTSAAETVKYSGDNATFGMRDRKMDIEGDGRLEYQSMVMTARHIKLDTDERELYAEGDPLVEDAETIAGDRMGYNFEHKTGAVADGTTAMQDYYYNGEEIRRFEDSTLKICSGKITSCDAAEPHYHFWSDRMKMKMDDKVVAAPVVMRVGHVPVFALPFYYKSLVTGRRSGILFPSFDFGFSSREGRYIRDFGYYWAASDYMDFIFEGDYNERRDLGLRVSNRYRKRYTFDGGFDFSRKEGLAEESGISDWQFRWNHNQPTLFDDYRFRAEVRLASQTLTTNDLAGSNNRDVVSGQLRSNVNVGRNFAWGNTNLTASRDEFPNAADDDPATDLNIYRMTVPSLSIGFRQINLLPAKKGSGQGSFLGELGRNTAFTQSYTTQVSEQGYEERTDRQYAASGRWGLTLRPPRLGIFDVSGGANASQSWERKEQKGRVWVDSTSSFVDLDSFEEDTRPGLSFNANLGSTLYGLLPINLGVIRTIRHTLRVRAGWSLSPGLSGHQDRRTSYTFAMGNTFDVKYLSAGPDSALVEKKLDNLLNWELSTSLDPKAVPAKQWSDISSALSIRPGQARYLQLRVNNTIDPQSLSLKSTRFTYGLNFSSRMDLGEGEAPPPEVRNAAIERLGLPEESARDSLPEDDPFLAAEMAAREESMLMGEQEVFDEFYERPGRMPSGSRSEDPTEGGRYIPFDVGLNLNYSYTNATENSESSKRATAGLNIKVDLTQNWSMRYTSSFDLAANLPVRQQYSLNRDLHCWRLEFTRTISTVDSSFGFRFYLRTIPELKFSRGREDFMGSVGGGLY